MTEVRSLSPEDEARVIHIQRIVRGRLARRNGAEIAGNVYRKCYDAVSGFAYYYNLHTGGTSWQKPLLLGSHDADWLASGLNQSAPFTEAAENFVDKQPQSPSLDPITILKSPEWTERQEESLKFQQKCAMEKRELMKKHRKRIARSQMEWEKKLLQEKQRKRAERLKRLENENRQRLHELYDGKRKENMESIREAAMHGYVDRIQELITSGISANAESAMGLTPLFAACQSGHFDVVKLLLRNGASVDHIHVKTGRTPLMEAASRTNVYIVKELLRHGAHIAVQDAHGETVFNGIKNTTIQNMVTKACQIWTPENAALFPTEFRHATLAFALIQKRQYGAFVRQRAAARKELIEKKQSLQRLCAEAKVRYDEELRHCNVQVTLLKKLEVLEAADTRYDAERARVLRLFQDALDILRDSELPRFLVDPVIFNIFSFCGRHWFDKAVIQRRTKKTRNKKHIRSTPVIQPTKLRASPDTLPQDLVDEWETFQQTLKSHRDQLIAVERNERFDTDSGVSRDPNGVSLATLDVTIIEAEYLPWRDPRTKELLDSFVRIFLRPLAKSEKNAHVMESEPHLGDQNPKWNFKCQLTAIPSVHQELSIQLIDQKRTEVAGEIAIPLRSLLDQKSHDEWHILPPTLRQQVIEKVPRVHPARIHVCVKFTHTKSILLTRELQQLIKTRESLVKKRREFIQNVLQTYIRKLA